MWLFTRGYPPDCKRILHRCAFGTLGAFWWVFLTTYFPTWMIFLSWYRGQWVKRLFQAGFEGSQCRKKSMVLDLRHYLGQAWFGMFMYVHAFIPLISVAWHKSGHRLPFRAKDYFFRFLRIIIPSNEELSPTVPCNRINRYRVFVRHIMAYHMIYSYFLLAQLFFALFSHLELDFIGRFSRLID